MQPAQGKPAFRAVRLGEYAYRRKNPSHQQKGRAGLRYVYGSGEKEKCACYKKKRFSGATNHSVVSVAR